MSIPPEGWVNSRRSQAGQFSALVDSKVIITACMRKLLGILNAMVRERLTRDQLKLTKIA